MPGLAFSLKGEDLGHLRIIAELWGIDLKAKEIRSALEELISRMSDADLVQQAFSNLLQIEQRALLEIIEHGGRLPWPAFSRKYGTIREIGAAKRDREKPYQASSVTVSERLWYRGWIARSFFDTSEGLLEFVFIPDELSQHIPRSKAGIPLERKEHFLISPEILKHQLYASDDILDDITTCIAALRRGMTLEEIHPFLKLAQHPVPIHAPLLKELCMCLNIIGEDGISVENARKFLEASRDEAMYILFQGWRSCKHFNELKYVPDLELEGAWENDPVRARNFILNYLLQFQASHAAQNEGAVWWSVPALIEEIHQNHADFQRPEGDYDSWHIRRISTGEYLRGFQNWWAVEGRWIRFFIAGPLFWLGLVDIAFDARPSGDVLDQLSAARLSSLGTKLLKEERIRLFGDSPDEIAITYDMKLCIPLKSPRHVRYQFARFMEWEGFTGQEYVFCLTPSSLQRAKDQGLKPHHLISLLERHVRKTPLNFLKAIARWDTHGTEVYLRRVEILEVTHAHVLEEILKSRARRFILKSLNPTTALIRRGARLKLLAEINALGLLGEVIDE